MCQLYVCNAPYLFTTVWAVVKGWLDPVTVEKIKILGDARELQDQVPVENLPSTLGGKCTCDGLGGCSLSDAGPWSTPEGKEKLSHIQAVQHENGDAVKPADGEKTS